MTNSGFGPFPVLLRPGTKYRRTATLARGRRASSCGGVMNSSDGPVITSWKGERNGC